MDPAVADGCEESLREQFWLGPDRAGGTVTFWADTTVVHLLVHGVRLKTVPKRRVAGQPQPTA